MELQQNMETTNLNKKKSGNMTLVLLVFLLFIVIVGGWLFIKYINNGNMKIFQSGDVCDGYDVTSENFDEFKSLFHDDKAREGLYDLYSKCEYTGSDEKGSLNIIKYKFNGCEEGLHPEYITVSLGLSLPVCVESSLMVDCVEVSDLPENMENIKEKVTITWDGEMWSEIPSCAARCIDGYNYDVEKSACVEDKGVEDEGEIDEWEENGGEEDEGGENEGGENEGGENEGGENEGGENEGGENEGEEDEEINVD